LQYGSSETKRLLSFQKSPATLSLFAHAQRRWAKDSYLIYLIDNREMSKI